MCNDLAIELVYRQLDCKAFWSLSCRRKIHMECTCPHATHWFLTVCVPGVNSSWCIHQPGLHVADGRLCCKGMIMLVETAQIFVQSHLNNRCFRHVCTAFLVLKFDGHHHLFRSPVFQACISCVWHCRILARVHQRDNDIHWQSTYSIDKLGNGPLLCCSAH